MKCLTELVLTVLICLNEPVLTVLIFLTVGSTPAAGATMKGRVSAAAALSTPPCRMRRRTDGRSDGRKVGWKEARKQGSKGARKQGREQGRNAFSKKHRYSKNAFSEISVRTI